MGRMSYAFTEKWEPSSNEHSGIFLLVLLHFLIFRYPLVYVKNDGLSFSSRNKLPGMNPSTQAEAG